MKKRGKKYSYLLNNLFLDRGIDLKNLNLHYTLFENPNKLLRCLKNNHLIKFEWEIIFNNFIYSENPNRISNSEIMQNIKIKEIKNSKSWYCVDCGYFSF